MIEAESPIAAFSWLRSLAGDWAGAEPEGRSLTVRYSVHAQDSVVMEHWQMSPESDALTLYHLDGERLMATHYCPLGNQPRLEMSDNRDGIIRFEFIDATNLPDALHPHQCAFQLRPIDGQCFWRSESYLENDGVKSYPVTYRRTGP